MKKRWIVLLGIGVATAIAIVALWWIAAGWLVAPPRKHLQPYHREWIAHAGDHGLRIRRGETPEKVPYLLCEPVAEPGRRGLVIRRQLLAKGISLGAYGEMRGTLVILHGRGMRKEDLILVAERFCAAGFRCVVPDLPAHGENPVSYSCYGATKSERELARDVLQCASKQFWFAPKPSGLWGMSMGGAFAIEAAAGNPSEWDALIVVSTFDELEPVISKEANRIFRGIAPIATIGIPGAVRFRGACALSRMRPIARASSLTMPVMIVHGTSDSVIGPDRSRRLYQAIPHGHKRWIEVTNADHGNVLVTPQPVFCEMAAWFIESMKRERNLPASVRPGPTCAFRIRDAKPTILPQS